MDQNSIKFCFFKKREVLIISLLLFFYLGYSQDNFNFKNHYTISKKLKIDQPIATKINASLLFFEKGSFIIGFDSLRESAIFQNLQDLKIQLIELPIVVQDFYKSTSLTLSDAFTLNNQCHVLLNQRFYLRFSLIGAGVLSLDTFISINERYNLVGESAALVNDVMFLFTDSKLMHLELKVDSVFLFRFKDGQTDEVFSDIYFDSYTRMGTYKTHQFSHEFFSYCNPITGKLTRYLFDKNTTEVIALCELFELQCNEQSASLRYSNLKEEITGEFKRELNLSQVNKGFDKALLEVLWIDRNEAIVVSRYSATKVLEVQRLILKDKLQSQSLSYTPFTNSSFRLDNDSIPLNWTGMAKYIQGNKLYFVYSYSKVTIKPGEDMINVFEDFIETNFTHYNIGSNLGILEVELR